MGNLIRTKPGKVGLSVGRASIIYGEEYEFPVKSVICAVLYLHGGEEPLMRAYRRYRKHLSIIYDKVFGTRKGIGSDPMLKSGRRSVDVLCNEEWSDDGQSIKICPV